MEESHNTKSVSLSIPFSSSDTASLVQEVLDVDKELKSSGIQRQISTVGVNLQVNGDLSKPTEGPLGRVTIVQNTPY
ncbi:unnamed protein product [Diatraea saccharalis]|uniref:Uncharacterized protein n=1 Tax=Diatraea saccharalis TaxID=40085 RepID=A0A9N9W9A1_9NEOP|nr:unnamed protein product [Diatraea saccharalis]